MKRRLERLYELAETTDLDIEDFKPRIRDHGERQEKLGGDGGGGQGFCCPSAGSCWTTWKPSPPTVRT